MLVALSGGPDSTALLHLLSGVREGRDLDLRAAHFDHGLREGSAGDARRVRARARALAVECRLAGPVAPLPADQEALREARYAFLRDVADEVGADRIATGHQADDQAETVLFRILRGTGIGGLAGIPERRGRIVRPLLGFGRSEIARYLEREGIDWLRDPSNLDPRWDRVRIRTRILPALEAAADVPVRERLRALARSAERADRALDRYARELVDRAREERGGAWGEEAFRLRRSPLADAPEETRGRAVRLLARELGVELARGGTRAAVEFISGGDSGTRVDVGDGLQVAREFDSIWLGWPDPPEPDEELSIPGPDAGEGTVSIGGRRWRVRWGPGDGRKEPRHRLAVPATRVPFPVSVRGWRDGDRIRREAGTRKLKELFNDHRVPLSRRSRIPMLASDGGRVLWVPGLARDPEFLPRDGEELLVITIHDA